MMKISLFYKPSVTKASIFSFVFSFIISIPILAHAGFFSGITDVLTGNTVLASEQEKKQEEESIYNSQTLPILESSIDPDMKNMKETPSVAIIGDEAIYPTDFFIGSGIENVSSGGITVYEVKEGDTLSEIAEEFDVSTNTIRWENNISGSNIRVGQKLNILPVTGVKHTVKKGDNLSKIASNYDTELEDMLVFNGINKDSLLKEGDVLFVPNGIIKTVQKTSSNNTTATISSNTKAPSGYFIKPAVGRITSPYGSRWGTFHYGVDIGNSRGTPVVASASGKVVKVVNYCKEGNSSCGGRYGNYITIEHPNGMKTKYAHLGSVNVSLGQNVNQGQLIGKIGNTGRSTGPHLHFEVINSNGSTVRPPVY